MTPTAALRTGILALGTGLMTFPAMAQTSLETTLRELPLRGLPEPGGTGFQTAATSLASSLQWLDGLLLVIIAAITLFVVGLMAWCIIRYNAKANPTPAKFTHNSPLEVAWTVIPIVVLVFIGAFSLPVLFDQQEIPEGDVTIKVTGWQWYWEYEYVDEGVDFTSYMIGQPATLADEAYDDAVPYVLDDVMRARLAEAGYDDSAWLLATDTAVVVPVGATVVMQVTAADVIHSWTIPAFGVKQDAVPGRLAELWFEAEEEGTYFGQCSELCGISHAYMPITVKVVSEEVYAEWLDVMRSDTPLTTW